MKDNAATNEVKDMIFIWLRFPVSLLFKLCDSLALKRRWEKIKIKFKNIYILEMKRATETWTSSKTKNAFPPGKTDLLQSLHLKKKSYIIKATLRQVNLKLKTVAISLKLLWSLTCSCHTQRTKLFNGKCLSYKQINNSWLSGILPDLNYLLPDCRKNEGKQKKTLIQWYLVGHKEILQPVRNILLMLLAPLNVCQHSFLCLLLSPCSRTASVFFVEAFQLERRKEL